MTIALASRAAAFAALACVLLASQNAAATFSGAGTAWIEVPHHASLVPTTGITVEAWVYRTSNSGSHQAVLRKNAASFNESYNLRASFGNARWVVKTQVNGTTEVTTGTPVPLNSWHHLAGTFDNSVARLYLDGVQIAQVGGLTGPILNTGGALKIANGDGEPWAGHLDCIRIWSVARTQQQIQSTMQYQVSGLPNLVSSWHLDNNLVDSTGANSGTPIGAVTFVPGAPLLSFLTAPASSPVGLPLVFQINHQVGSLPYVLDISFAGTSPGVTIAPGVVIPLNPPWLNWETGSSLTSLFVNFLGILNGAGHASPYVNVPLIPALAGTQISATYVALNPANPALIDFISPPVQTTLAGPTPSITNIAPQTGPTTGGTAITITGTNFQAGATVQIGGAPATGVSVTVPGSINCVSPPGTLGAKPVVVTNPDTTSVTLPNGFTYVAPLVLSLVAPLVAAPGVAISILGSGIQPGASLLVGGTAVTPFSVTPTQIAFTNPAGVPCNGPVQVTNPDGQTASKPFNVSPTINGAIPASGSAAGGNSISIVGANFFAGSTVQVNGATVPSTILGNTLLTITMPAGSPGPVQITVTSMNGCAGSGSYTYL